MQSVVAPTWRSLASKCETWLEMVDSDERSSLSRRIFNFVKKSFYNFCQQKQFRFRKLLKTKKRNQVPYSKNFIFFVTYRWAQ
jgi:hypothetical protein